jgi:general stress protein YciG
LILLWQEAGRNEGILTSEAGDMEFYEKIVHKGGQRAKEQAIVGKKAKGLNSDR